MSRNQFLQTLDAYAHDGRTALLWLRDDDAIEPTVPLSRLLELSANGNMPMTIAAIPANATPKLAERLNGLSQISVAVHGWDHVNHAPADEKKQELGLHRGESVVVGRLAEGLTRIHSLFGDQSVPLLVPPWNRIAPDLIRHLPGIGYRALSVFGPERRQGPLWIINTHVDIMDWKGSRGGRAMDVLYAEADAHLKATSSSDTPLGILTHHLVHDEAAWRFLDDLVELTSDHPGCRWVSIRELIDPE